MALFENFPYTNLHELNLDWIIEELKKVKEGSVLSVNGLTGEVILYEAPTVMLPEVNVNQWEIIRNVNGDNVGIYFKKDGTAYITTEGTLDKIYTANNPPPYPVTSVNGETGDVIIFSQQYIELPTLTDQQLSNWNIYRTVNGILSGIQFDGAGNAYVMNGSYRYKIWDAHNSPDWEARAIDLPALTGTGTEWSMTRMVNNTEIGIAFDRSGWAYIVHGNDYLPIYTNGVTEPSDFNVPTNAILEIKENLATGDRWGIVREVNSQINGIVFIKNANTGKYEAYVTSDDGQNVTKLLTTSDIPSSTGVISINGLTGVVTMDGSQIPISPNDSRNIKVYIDQKTALKSDITCVAYYQSSLIASRAYKTGDYIIIDGIPYKAITNITANSTMIPDTHITAVNTGITNDLITEYLTKTTIANPVVEWNTDNVDSTKTSVTLEAYGRIRLLKLSIWISSASSSWVQICKIQPAHAPDTILPILAFTPQATPDERYAQIRDTGWIRLDGASATTNDNTKYQICFTYLV